ncbi:MAG: hypothetical protein [Wendovervirus sonii]|uniref:Uncharacterized protein n=1 Tax=phage Lak_Megaphage_Sonny TaxID=3109229 RepID=A0ABZ0Z3N8_9CAUD|nr:MAG: hypothetical protein [phage Lak_Megaphage_Sonny]
MTISKMINILSSYEDCPLFEVKDSAKYDFETDTYPCQVREIILLSDVIEQFKNNEGDFFDKYKVSSDFKELLKLIESHKTMEIFKLYEDSQQEKLDKWDTYHPDETYEEYTKRKFDERCKKMQKNLTDITTISLASMLSNNYQ